MNPAQLLYKLVEAEDLAGLSQLEVHPVRQRLNNNVGLHDSKKLGGSAEFTQHRAYNHGDDLRHLDWRVLAKNERHYIKIYNDETQISANFILDASGSMGYGKSTKTKLDYAKSLCACLSKILVAQKDSLGFIAANEESKANYALSRGPAAFYSILHQLDLCKASGENTFIKAIESFINKSKHHQEVFLISDVMLPTSDFESCLSSLFKRGHTVTLFHILAPEEIHFDFDQNAQFQCMEDVDFNIDLDPLAIKRAYTENFIEYSHDVQRMCDQYHCRYIGVSTGVQLVDILRRVFHPQNKYHTSKHWTSYEMPSLKG